MTEIIKVCPSAEELSVTENHVVCPYCKSVFGSSSRLKMHLVRSHKIGEIDKTSGIRHFHCPEVSCKYSLDREENSQRFFTKMKYLKQHYQKVHLEKNFMCEKCKKYFTSEKLRMDHIEKECDVNFTCLTCTKSYTTKIALMTHCKRNNHVLPKVTKRNQRIVPKGQVSVQMEDIAAVALSELSWKVVVKKSVDASVQTDHRSCRRKRVKSNKKTQTQKGAVSSCTQTENPDLLDFPLNQFSSATQTNDLMIDLNMLIDQHHNHTQTQDLILDDDSPIILSDTHTQTTDLDDYSHNYTQTQDFFLQDFVELSDIETQTAWASLPLEDSGLVSAQTQTSFQPFGPM